jgi:hypothetical protein
LLGFCMRLKWKLTPICKLLKDTSDMQNRNKGGKSLIIMYKRQILIYSRSTKYNFRQN